MNDHRFGDCCMSEDRRFQEVTARCISIVVAYHVGGRVPLAQARMTEDARDLAREVATWVATGPEIEERIIRPLLTELVVRYGSDDASRLVRGFLDTFWETALRPGSGGRVRRLRSGAAQLSP